MSNPQSPALVGNEKSSSPPQQLFRKQAIEHHTIRQYGTVILARPASHRALTFFIAVMAISIVAFFFFLGTTRKVQTQGVLIPDSGVIRVRPSLDGIVIESRVKEGQAVAAGEVLFVLSSERSSAFSASPQKNISTLLMDRRESYGLELKQSSMQGSQRLEAISHRLEDLASELARIDEQIVLQTQRITLAQGSLNRFRDLASSKFISEAQLQDKYGELLEQRQRLADLERAKAAGRRDLVSSQSEYRVQKIQLQRDAAALTRNISVAEQDLIENEARREVLVRAPHAGTIAAITTEKGQTVAANTVMASILPQGAKLEAEIYVPSRSAGFIDPGTVVMLRYQAYPYQKFGQYRARVIEVANTSLSPSELPYAGALPSNGSEPLYRVRLALDQQSVQAYGRKMPLKSGMLTDASIMLEHRRLYEWVLEPLYSVTGRI